MVVGGGGVGLGLGLRKWGEIFRPKKHNSYPYIGVHIHIMYSTQTTFIQSNPLNPTPLFFEFCLGLGLGLRLRLRLRLGLGSGVIVVTTLVSTFSVALSFESL